MGFVYRTALIAIGSSAFASVAGAQNVDTSEWVCEFCPFESGNRADVEIGASSVSDDSAFFGNVTGLDEEGVYANVDGEGSYVSEKHRLQWTAEDLALDSRFAEVRGSDPGTYDYNVSWREIPRRRFITTETIFVEGTDGSLTLPAGWVRAGTTSDFTALDTSLVSRDIESDRSFLDVGGRFLGLDGFTLSANYRRQDHDGLGIIGGSYYSTASQLPMPFDYVTDEVDLGVRYNADRGYVSLAWYLSEFESGGDAFGWESPFVSTAGAEFAELAQPPDNSFQQLTLSGGYAFAVDTHLSASAAFGQIEQDDMLLPYTTNQNLSPAPLPVTSLDGEIDTARYAISVTSTAIDKARIRVSYRYDERDNKTPQELWARVIADTFVSADVETNIPYSYERSALRLHGDYDLTDTIRVSGGYDRDTIDRDFQEVAEQEEDKGWGRLRWRPNAIVDIDLTGGASKRDIDRYNETLAVAIGQNPLMRKYNLAYRYREFGELRFTASMPNAPVSFTLAGEIADDSYTRSELGLITADDSRFTADLSWAMSDAASLYLTGGTESIESVQLGSESFSTADWRATNEDTFMNVGVGFRARQTDGKFGVQFDYTRADGTSEIRVQSEPGGRERFPDIESTMDDVRLIVTYRQTETFEWTASARFQRLVTDDWALDGVEPDTIPAVLSLGAEPYDDDVFIFGIGFRYLTGGTPSSGGN